MNVKVRLDEGATLPQYQTAGASGFDFHSIEMVKIEPGYTMLIKTGVYMEIPEGYELQVRPRSGLSLKTGLRVANAPGTVDSDYRGEICIIMHNAGNYSQMIYPGDRIAQGVIVPVIQANFEVVEELSDTVRGSKGYGSTGN